MNAPIALIDLDGTLADFDGAMTERLRELAAPGEEVNPDRDWELPHIKARRRLIKSQPGFWRSLPKLNDGFEVLDLLRHHGFRLMVLTKGPVSASRSWTEKVDWVKEHVPDAGITISQDKSLVYGKLLFDDWPKYVDPWLDRRPRGLAIMLASRWNADYEHERAFRYTRDSYSELSNRIKHLLEEMKEDA
jgi:5'(3')-deoxyribonucleotidase